MTFTREVLAHVVDFFRGEFTHTTLDPKDSRFWATTILFAIFVLPALIVAEIIAQVAA
ncbi:hypothetical protein ACIBEJ_34890 [Nonomuraea sp. NPDC050790]|uniref:hypothetical protein n=1 Tax=Nonomuraea sp. NPDC050790 TaxID=3364371 RepID=UPI0037B2205D